MARETSSGPGAGPSVSSLLDGAPCGFLSFADDGRVTAVNRTLCEMLGRERESLVGRHVEDLLGVGSRIFYQTHLFPLVRLHGHAEEIYLTLRPEEGDEIGVLANLVRHTRNGEPANDCVVVRVREREKFEAELLRARKAAEKARDEASDRARELQRVNRRLQEQTAEMERQKELLEEQAEEAERLRAEAQEANRVKGQFLAMMSHELRTPLNAIAGYVGLLEMGIHGPLTDEQRDALERIGRSQRHLLRLINDILNLSRLQAGRLDYRTEPVPVAETVSSVEPMIGPQLNEKRLRFEARVTPGLTALADQEKVELILLNLLGNAVKFTPAGGGVTLEGSVHEARADRVRVRVRDTGIGIEEERLQGIFEPFVQVEVSRARASEGSGLGLAISRDLARGMGGDLEAESAPGEGSTFTLTLPRAESR